MEKKELNEKAHCIVVEIDKIKEVHTAELKPYRDKLDELNESFLDGKLLDKNGDVVKVGMLIQDSKNKEFKVLRRFQQCFFEFMGNAQVEVLKIGGKRSVNVHYRDLAEYTIKED